MIYIKPILRQIFGTFNIITETAFPYYDIVYFQIKFFGSFFIVFI